MNISPDFIESLMKKYERYIAPFTFAIGFALDTFTLTRVDFWIDHLILLGYLFLAGGGIAFFYAYESGRMRLRFLEWGIAFVPLLIQFSFGGLFSAFLIFYTTSAGIGRTVIFLFALAAILIGNERFRKYYERLTFQISVFFIALFSYSIFFVPLVAGAIGVWVFLVSGAASIGLVSLFLYGLSRIAPEKENDFFAHTRGVRMRLKSLAFNIAIIFLLFNFFYFTNIIPPIPLSLKESGVYHSVERTRDGNYQVQFEEAPWYLPLQETARTFHWRPGDPIYYFTSVFAPVQFAVPIVHRWSFYDEEKKEWIRRGDIQFPIFGGRDRGYRGYSFKTGIEPGKWRVEVITQSGQLLGREKFIVVERENIPPLTDGAR